MPPVFHSAVLTSLQHTSVLYIQPALSFKTYVYFLRSFYMFLIILRILSPNSLSRLDYVTETLCAFCHSRTQFINMPFYLDIFQDSIPYWNRRFSLLQSAETGSRPTQPTVCWITALLPWEQSRWGVMPNNHIHLYPSLRMGGVVLPLNHTPSWCA